MKYEIRIRGYIQSHWFEALEHIKEVDKTTILRGNLKDQAELYGVLRRIQELGIELISIIPIEEEV
ncbi:MAG: hypothetical protein CVU98_01655 [Firmicutes bacterium HGW-Firmicutes-3]|jgi:hypothetical protein|nr:MAG: hypothetical protein CVU98_01655 [Firmicutes bacterium HGW-Firmicutes-3]